ncbi:hypothetical protein EXIGLDRAFT_753045 [Exidia glandulosa HHB12029]|uniref:BTB domain-containing protein n=1 Tax=Exidia glandulosa HHB12029 TaxID=1314781 RepID=A0A165E2N9_EXIGL|nr:hypothetical protein EXIGLDRAFT_753045 [Exidia glandulosa HHB12029]
MSTTNAVTVADVPAGLTRDDKFYRTDGNLVLRAENTLFRVHRSVLTEMSSVIADTLQLPQPEHSSDKEGESDARPVKLPGDTAQQFRSLMWALYSRPDEVKKYLETSDLESRCCRLLDLVAITHKYDCPDLMNWALDLASGCCKTIDKPSTNLVTALIHMYRLGLLGFVDWAEPAVRRGSLADVSLIRLASASTWTSIESFAYYRIVCRGPSCWSALGVNSSENLRLLRGYVNLSETWTLIAGRVPPIEHVCGGSPGVHATGPCPTACITVWDEICRNPKVVKLGVLNKDSTVDIQGRLAAAAGLVEHAFAVAPRTIIYTQSYGTNRPSPPDTGISGWHGIMCRAAFRDSVNAYAARSEKMIQRCAAALLQHLLHSIIASRSPSPCKE